ncbi:hypothetical protein lerEdw1_010379 [Lerista edwardsae]|nr:hypothetical protein lerEdw1_010379 [Lerista edwardsae]
MARSLPAGVRTLCPLHYGRDCTTLLCVVEMRWSKGKEPRRYWGRGDQKGLTPPTAGTSVKRAACGYILQLVNNRKVNTGEKVWESEETGINSPCQEEFRHVDFQCRLLPAVSTVHQPADDTSYRACPSSRANYLYMGPKCNLWSTLDVILVCALPAVVLAAVVAVSLQWISYCRSKRQKRTRRHSTRASQLRSQAQLIAEYVPNPTKDARYAPPQKGVKVQNAGAAPNFKFPLISVRHQPYEEVQPTPVRDFRYISQQPMRQATSGNGNALGNRPVEPFNVWESEIPDVDYEEENPFAAMAMRQLTNVGTPALSRPSYNSP